MRMYDLIIKKREGKTLSKDEIEYIVNGFTKGDIPDYQMSAFLMAIYFKGMNSKETVDLTIAMANSGDRMDLSPIKGIKVDKHSTGGVGDKTTLILGPILASLGVPIAKMSGRGLGHTGGTIDKLESIKGFKTAISEEIFFNNVNSVHLAIAGQTANLAPADKRIYALRDVTATVDNYSLIASSIMSKKLASGADAIILDVKTGSGAFMVEYDDALHLAKEMVSIGNMAGKDTYAVITDMNEPLGYYAGNSLEVIEAIEFLKGNMERRLREVVYALASYMLLAGKKIEHISEARPLIENAIESGSALNTMKEFVAAQGGDVEYINDTSLFPKAKYIEPVYVNSGYVYSCDTKEVGNAVLVLGGGRETKDSEIDLTVGVKLLKTIGEYINNDEPFAYIYANDLDKLEQAKNRLINAYVIKKTMPEENLTVKTVVTKNDL